MNTFRQPSGKQRYAAKAPTRIATTMLSLFVGAFTLSVDLEFVVNKIAHTNFAGSLISTAHADDDDDHRKREAEREEHERNESAAERAREAQRDARKRGEKAAKRARKEAKKARERAEKAAKKARKDATKRAKRLAEQQRRDKKELDETRENSTASSRDNNQSTSRTKTSSRSKSRKSNERDDDSDQDRSKRDDKKVYKSASRKTEEDDERDEDQRSAQNNRNDDDDDNGDNDDGSRRSRDYKVEKEDETPDTLLKFFQKVFTAPKSTKSKSKSKSKKTKDKKSDKQKTEQTASSKKKAAKRKTAAKRRRPRRRVFAPVTPRARFMPNEVLAINMNRRSLKRARQMGFRVGRTSHFSSLGLRVHSLRTPRGMSAGRARRLLRRKIPGSRLALNKVYRVYHAARGRQKAAVQRTVPVNRYQRLHPCGRGKCYAAKAIRWRSTLTNCARTVKIGVIDTAYDKKHPAFYGQRIHSGQRSNAEHWRSAPNKHGTGVLALLTGNPKTTTAGLIPGATFIAHNVFFADKAGRPVSDTTSMLDALNLMNGFGVDIINLSLTGPKDPVIAKAIAEMSKNGIIFVAAAGNGGPAAKPSYPAAYPQVIAVTAVNRKSRGYRYANRGSYIDIAAPGVDIWTAMPGSKAGYQSGTSFAVPYVTAVIASIYKQYGPMSKEQILRHITTRDLGAPGRDRVYGRGLVLAPRRCKKAPALAKASLLR